MIRIVNLKTMKEALPPPFSVLCLGNFDGVHLGHRALAAETLQQKQTLDAEFQGIVSGAWLFDPPPTPYLFGERAPRLSATEEKLEHFARIGLDYAFLADFSELCRLTPTDFVKNILVGECHAVHIVCGYNFHFAKDASGNTETLSQLMDGHVSVMPCITLDGKPISSSAIRTLLAEGKIEQASAMLGYPFALSAKVLHGKALGKTIGIPTVNQCFPLHAARLSDGIYVSRTWVDGISYPSVSNIGHRPTFDDGEQINCETHVIGFDGNLYGKRITVEFFKRLRGEIRFSSIEALQAQIQADIAATKQYFEEQRRQI
ncbi:MAG: riboflavin biosynthesis protein RibF [Clostridia bacterium]|nr:riboflavin biosynthesis protein RibF [Clostridia bacterium]